MKSSQILGLRTCIYKVPDLEAGKDWYSKAFNLSPYFDEPFYVGYNIGGYELGLLPEKNEHNNADNIQTYWGVENIQTEYKRFLDIGATSHEEPNNVGEEIEVASVRDPWGNVIGLIYNPYFKLPG